MSRDLVAEDIAFTLRRTEMSLERLITLVSEHVNGGSLTLKDAAAVIGTSPGALRRAIARGSLKAKKIGRDWTVTPAEVARYRTEQRRIAHND